MFCQILLISRTLRRGKLLEFDKKQVKLLPNFTSIPFDYLLISWVTNYAHNRGFLTCLLYGELHALKSLKHAFWLKFTWFLISRHKHFEILLAVYKMFQSWVSCQIFVTWLAIIRHEWTENGARLKSNRGHLCICLRVDTFWSRNCRLKLIIWPKQTGPDDIQAKIYKVKTLK